MSISELLLIFIIALIAFRPAKLPMLVKHLGSLFNLIIRLKKQSSFLFEEMIKRTQLEENRRKAREIEKP